MNPVLHKKTKRKGSNEGTGAWHGLVAARQEVWQAADGGNARVAEARLLLGDQPRRDRRAVTVDRRLPATAGARKPGCSSVIALAGGERLLPLMAGACTHAGSGAIAEGLFGPPLP
jgi:hypothetical protein